MWDWSGHMGAWWWLAVPMMIAFWTLVIWLVVVVTRRNESTASGPRAEDVLAERFARGEFDEAEYRHRRELIRT